jgi:hypothetical protein
MIQRITKEIRIILLAWTYDVKVLGIIRLGSRKAFISTVTDRITNTHALLHLPRIPEDRRLLVLHVRQASPS